MSAGPLIEHADLVAADLAQRARAAAPLAAAALQQWYAADAHAARSGLYHYDDPALAVRWPDWRSQPARTLARAVIAASGQRSRMQNTARWWNSANAITAVIGYLAVTGDRRYLEPVVARTFAAAPGVRRPVRSAIGLRRPASVLSRARYPGFLNGFYDDEGWWALAWTDAYDLTGDARYLTAASDLFADMTRGWDGAWGGGIYWGKHDGAPDRAGAFAVPRGWTGPYKNAIANELFIAAAAGLGLRHRRRDPGGSGHREYQQWAQRGWEWFSAPPPRGVAMINEAGLVNDSPNRQGVNDNTLPVWSYNQGVILSGLADLGELTGDPAYLARAEQIAGAFIGQPWHVRPQPAEGRAPAPPPTSSGVIGGILHEHNDCRPDGGALPAGHRLPDAGSAQFKGIFVRHLARLHARTGTAAYRSFIEASAASALDHMNDRHQFGGNWAAPPDTADFVRQTAGLDLINAALLVSKPGPA